jgi:hypothetical protein
MNRAVPSTREILALRALGRPIDERWVDWAVSMLQAGHDTPHLAILAGEMPPFNYFETVPIVDKALEELGYDWSDKKSAIKGYIAELLERMLQHEMTSDDALHLLRDLCIELHYAPFLMDFYRLYYAQRDLRTSEIQWYWPDATRHNIERAIREYAAQWIQKNKR